MKKPGFWFFQEKTEKTTNPDLWINNHQYFNFLISLPSVVPSKVNMEQRKQCLSLKTFKMVILLTECILYCEFRSIFGIPLRLGQPLKLHKKHGKLF